LIFEAAVDGRTLKVEVRQQNGRYSLALDGEALDVDFAETGAHFASLLISGRSYEVGIERHTDGYRIVLPGESLDVRLRSTHQGSGSAVTRSGVGPARLEAPMPGKIVRVLTAVGEEVTVDQGLIVMEAMKMENELRAPRAGRVQTIHVSEGQAVETGAVLVALD
jgi:biotin carboxyl carrier protein